MISLLLVFFILCDTLTLFVITDQISTTMSTRPKSIIKSGTNRFYADGGPQKRGDRVRIAPTPADVHMLVADSFGTRLDQFMRDVSFLDASEHILPVPPHQNRNHNEIRVVNHSRSSRRLSEGLSDREISDIMERKPKSILIMLGMVDIASQQDDTMKNDWFMEEIIRVANETKQKLTLRSHTREDTVFVEKLTFHFAHLQHWGEEYTPRFQCLSPSDVKTIRKKNMKKVTRYLNRLLDHNIILVDMNVNRPIRDPRDGLHYDGETSRKLFQRMKTLFFRFSCRSCKANMQIIADTRRDLAVESRKLILAPSCEGSISVDEQISADEVY